MKRYPLTVYVTEQQLDNDVYNNSTEGATGIAVFKTVIVGSVRIYYRTKLGRWFAAINLTLSGNIVDKS